MKVIGLNRRLAAIMFTDMVGYSALTEGDEALGLELLEEHRVILRNRVAEFGGREIKSTGDGFLIEFGAVIDAVHCAIQIQTSLFERNLTVPEDRQVRIRIGLHLGDIVDTERDVHGNGVNIAARIEPFAAPGSVAVSQQVLDQVRGQIDFPIRKMGRLALKNIESPPEVYRFVLPWELAANRSPLKKIAGALRNGLRSLRSPVPAAYAAAAVGALALGILFIRAPAPLAPRAPAGVTTPIFLPNQWEIALGNGPEKVWRKFDPARAHEFIDEIAGPYELRLKFPVEKTFEHPALVLGLIAQRHEAYLNGQFIGGARKFTSLVSYTLGSALSTSHENELIVKAESRPSLTPGLYLLPGIAPQIGDFDAITELVSAQHLSYHLVQSIYLAVCTLTALAAFCYALFRRRRKHLYSALFLVMGAIGVSFYNSYAVESLDYRMYRFLNLLSFAGSCVALCSIELESRGKRRLEKLNNLAGGAFLGIAMVLLLVGPVKPSVFLERLEILFGVVAVYAGLTFVSYFGSTSIRSVSHRSVVRIFGAVLFGITVSIFLAKIPSAFGRPLLIFNERTYDLVRQVAISYPIVFALSIFGIAIADYIRKTRELVYKQRKDDLVLGLAAIVGRSEDYPKTIRLVQSRVAEFLKATRSTVYVLDETGKILRADYRYGSSEVQNVVADHLDADSGIIGYCLKTGAPVWVEDISVDERFREDFSHRFERSQKPRTYRTGSFIVAPIQVGRKIFGVITIADRRDGRPFSAQDFCLMHLASKDLSLVLSEMNFRAESPLKFVA